MRVGSIPIFVWDQSRALMFYRDALGFEVVTDTPYSPYSDTYRWIAVAPTKNDTELILFSPAMAINPERIKECEKRVGIWTGIVLLTTDIQRTYEELRQRGVQFEAEPRQQPWGGCETWFSDPDSNRFHLCQRP